MRIEHRLFGHMATSALADCTTRAFIAMGYNGILWPPHACLPNRETLTNRCHAYALASTTTLPPIVWSVPPPPSPTASHPGKCQVITLPASAYACHVRDFCEPSNLFDDDDALSTTTTTTTTKLKTSRRGNRAHPGELSPITVPAATSLSAHSRTTCHVTRDVPSSFTAPASVATSQLPHTRRRFDNQVPTHCCFEKQAPVNDTHRRF